MRSLHIVSPEAITILEIVHDSPGCSQSYIARELGVSYGTIAKNVRLLHSCGLLEIRQGDKVANRSEFAITITDEGRSAMTILNQLEEVIGTSTPANGAQWGGAC